MATNITCDWCSKVDSIKADVKVELVITPFSAKLATERAKVRVDLCTVCYKRMIDYFDAQES